MGLTIVNEERERELPDEGSYPAACIRVLDMGTQVHPKYGPKRKINVAMEILGEETEDGEPFVVYKNYTASLGPKASLTKDLKTWMGLKFEKGDEFDFEQILGQLGMVTIVHNESTDGNVYANIDTISKLPKGLKPGKPTLEPSSLYLNDDFDEEVFDELPDWLQDKIKKTDEYKSLFGSKADEEEEDEEEEEEEEEVVVKKKTKKQVEKPAKSSKKPLKKTSTKKPLKKRRR